jgi:DNA repair protein RadC
MQPRAYPSQKDVQVTEQIVSAGKLLAIEGWATW